MLFGGVLEPPAPLHSNTQLELSPVISLGGSYHTILKKAVGRPNKNRTPGEKVWSLVQFLWIDQFHPLQVWTPCCL